MTSEVILKDILGSTAGDRRKEQHFVAGRKRDIPIGKLVVDGDLAAGDRIGKAVAFRELAIELCRRMRLRLHSFLVAAGTLAKRREIASRDLDRHAVL